MVLTCSKVVTLFEDGADLQCVVNYDIHIGNSLFKATCTYLVKYTLSYIYDLLSTDLFRYSITF